MSFHDSNNGGRDRKLLLADPSTGGTVTIGHFRGTVLP
jgi:hypothetical protein